MSGSDAGHHLEGYARVAQRQRLLAAAAVHQRIAALEPDHRAAGPRQPHQHRVDLLLRHRMTTRTLADVDPHHTLWHEVDDLLRHETVVDQGVAGLKKLVSPQGQQLRVAGARTNQKHPSAHAHPALSRDSSA